MEVKALSDILECTYTILWYVIRSWIQHPRDASLWYTCGWRGTLAGEGQVYMSDNLKVFKLYRLMKYMIIFIIGIDESCRLHSVP